MTTTTSTSTGARIAALSPRCCNRPGALAGWAAAVVAASMLASQCTPLASGQFEYEVIKDFGFAQRAGAHPGAKLIQGRDGKLYGSAVGAVFRLDPDKMIYTVLHTFAPDDPLDGAVGLHGLIQASDGMLYGTTHSGAADGREGTAFRLHPEGSGYQVLHAFSAPDGLLPSGPLREGSDGALYGTTTYGGANNGGAIFKLNKDGSGHSILLHLTRPSPSGDVAQIAGLVEGNDDAWCAIARYGGEASYGAVLRRDQSGAVKVLHDFVNGGGRHPACLIRVGDNRLCGITTGERGERTVFTINDDGSGFKVLHDFADTEGVPNPDLLLSRDGRLYGSTTWFVYRLNLDDSGFEILHTFAEDQSNGGRVWLMETPDGVLYGTTEFGGNDNAGSIFRLHTDGGGFELLHSFYPTDGDGRLPNHLMQGSDGVLYGTTLRGGTYRSGALFKLNPRGGEYTVLHSFGATSVGEVPDGIWPVSLSEWTDGSLYGVTDYGGASNGGTVFRIDKDGSGYRLLLSIPGGIGEGGQAGGLVAAPDGLLYGMTFHGGAHGVGTLFRLASDGTGHEIVHSFEGVSWHKWYMGGSLIAGTDGVLYGTRFAHSEEIAGIIFKLSAIDRAYTQLRSFRLEEHSALWPQGLVEGSDNILYGTTKHGGDEGAGSIFKINKEGGGYALLYAFTGREDGGIPCPVLAEGSDGALFGTTAYGGALDGGVLFRLTKDGTDFSVLRTFSASAGDRAYPGRMISSSDGSLYGTTASRGPMGFGTVFALRPRPVMQPSLRLEKRVFVRAQSIPGSRLTLQRSRGFPGAWESLESLLVPGTGIADFTDPSPPPSGAFYRAVRP